MAQKYHFKGAAGAVIPVADDEWIIDGVSLDYNQHEFEVRFYTDNTRSTLATPGAGTLTVQYSMGGSVDVWRNFADGLAIAASDTASNDWVPPSSVGSAAKFRLAMTGVTTATHFSAWVVSK